jgi:glycosyltransferase involved in cell wall biosynthesis
MSNKEISVIVPIYNDAKRLKLLLEALDHQTLDKSRWEAVIVDNNSIDSPETVVTSYPFAQCVKESKTGSSAARNTGIRESSAPLLAFTDSDCIPTPNWLETALKLLEDNKAISAIGGAIIVFLETPNKPSLTELFEVACAFPQQEFVEKLNYGATANMITRRSCFDLIGGFDENLQSSEDENWGQRLVAAGGTIVYSSEVAVNHPARNWEALKRKIRRVAKGKAMRLLRKDYGELHILAKILWLVFWPERIATVLARVRLNNFKQCVELAAFVYYRNCFEAFQYPKYLVFKPKDEIRESRR